jgi:leucyl/phenylalanyl-tRNA--protein transferase
MADLPISPVALRSFFAGAPRTAAADDARAALFREAPSATIRRWILGFAFACHPKRIADLPPLLIAMARDAMRGGTVVPQPGSGQPRPDTFAGIVSDASPESILAAARLGYFPLAHCGPLKWWTREKRMVLKLGQQRINKNVRRLMRQNAFRVTFDEAFDEVIKACAGPRKGRPNGLTWITPRMMQLYAELHDLGHVHSFEVWNREGRLVGGGYGLAVGRIFFTESQFSHENNTSKIGFAVLNHHLEKWGYVLNDGKDETPTLAEVGFELVSRGEFEELLREHGAGITRAGPWRMDGDLASIAA